MTIETSDGITAIRSELDRLEAAYALRKEVEPAQEPIKMELTKAEANKVIDDRIAGSTAKLKELGFVGKVTRL
jgi:hypothetical protein